MADETRQVIIDVEIEDKDFDKEIADVNKQLRRNREEIKELSKDYDQNAEAIAKLEAQNRELSQSKRRLIKESQTEANSLNALRQRLASLTKERNETNTATTEGAKRFSELQKEIKSTSDALKEVEQEGGDYRRNVGNYTEDTEIFGVSVSKLSENLLTTAGLIGSVVAAGALLISFYTSSARGANDLARASDRLDSILKSFGNTLADTAGEGGFFDNLLRETQIAFLGIGRTILSDIEVQFEERLRLQEVERIDIERNAKAQLDAAERLRQVRDEERNSIEERRDANNALAAEIDDREQTTIDFLERRLGVLKALSGLDEENLERQKAVKEVEFDIADAREEAQGFRSEQLANDLALSRELVEDQIALTEARIQAEIQQTEEGTKERLELELRLIAERRELELQAAGENELRRQTVIQNALNAEFELREAFRDAEIEAEKQNQADLDKLIDDALEESNKQIEAQAKREEALEKQRDKQRKDRIAKDKAADQLRLQAEQEFFNSTIQIFAEGTDAAKGFALAQIAFDTGRAISALTASSEGNPANAFTFGGAGIAQFLAGIARIGANIAQAKRVLESGDAALSSVSLVSGGGGGGSSLGVSGGTDLANVNAALLSQFGDDARANQATNDAFSSAVANIPAPQVAVTDINTAARSRLVKVSEANLG